MNNGINEQTALYAEIAESGPGAIAIVNGDNFEVVFSNRQFRQNFDHDNDAAGDTFLQLLDTNHQERLKAQFLNVLHNPAARNRYSVYKMNGKNGAELSAYIYASPLQETTAGVIQYHLLILTDISKWNLPFISFDTRDLFLQQFNDTAFGTFEWYIGMDKVFWSDGVYEIYEVDKSKTDINYSFIKSFTHPENRETVDGFMANTMADTGATDVEIKIITAKKNVKIIRSLARVIKDKDGKTIKFVGSVHDITRQRQVEEDLKNNVLELNRSNKELEEFAYVASHDLQEPLRKISTFSDRLNEKYKDVLKGDGEMYLGRMMASAENMRQLINSLLEFSRISKSTLPFAPVNINFIIHQVKADLELPLEETGATIVCEALPTIMASMIQIKQLFENLINNAVKFRKADIPPVINISAKELLDDDKIIYSLQADVAYIKIEVTDNGIGFENEYASKIFQIFQRLHGKSEYPGSGIGLAICKKIVEHHKGVMYAKGTPGEGARFVIILPA